MAVATQKFIADVATDALQYVIPFSMQILSRDNCYLWGSFYFHAVLILLLVVECFLASQYRQCKARQSAVIRDKRDKQQKVDKCDFVQIQNVIFLNKF